MTPQAENPNDTHPDTPPTSGPGVKWKGENAILTPSREHILGAGVMFLICLMFTGYDVSTFFWVPLIPLAFMAWTLYVRTVVGSHGITTRYMFRKGQTMTWDEFSGIQFSNSGKAYAVARDKTAQEEVLRQIRRDTAPDSTGAANSTTPQEAPPENQQYGGAKRLSAQGNKSRNTASSTGIERRFWLPGVTFNSLVTLSAASEGRIPDPVTPGRESADRKVQVVHKDGYAVLMTKEEYADYEKKRRAEEAAKKAARNRTTEERPVHNDEK
ncbi:PH domain-containing protein [Corynebacterium anserum]|uniref:PH domain-containing protein n=1 Tax=Corynebacterium anserum TaxID=2684406 RepID=UPI0021AF511D|nr:PH domain-containing protein [Corynebacterium anserum]